jgi:hypothetical protein
VHMSSLCTHHAYVLIKFIKKLKKITHVLSILLHLCIKIQVKTHYSLSITKKREISNNYKYVRKFLFFTATSLLKILT